MRQFVPKLRRLVPPAVYCADKPTLAQDDAGWLWHTTSSCLPPGLVALPSPPPLGFAGPCPAEEADVACAAHADQSSCEADPHWVCTPMIFAAFDAAQRYVVGPAPFLGCMADRPPIA
jgi:hypothetical protein